MAAKLHMFGSDRKAKRPLASPRVCLVPGCRNSMRTRGNCHTHYQQCQRLLREGKADDADLVRRGLRTPPGEPGSSPTLKFDGFLKGSTVRGEGK
jgi:hypothetical protein